MENKKLTDRQEAFCRHYVANGFNATQAAISAGYSEDSARAVGSENLTKTDIKQRVAELAKGTTERAKASADDVFEFLTFAAEFNPSEWMNVTKTGRLALKCDFDELPPRVQKLATKIKPTMAGVEVTWFSKEKALEMLARFHGMNNDTLKVTNTYETKTDEDIENELKELEGK